MRRRKTIIVAVFVVIIIAIVTAIVIYRSRIAPFRITVLEVDGTSIKMQDFLKRASMIAADPRSVLETLITEQIIKEIALQPPYSIKVTEKDVELYLREMARGKGKTNSDDGFQTWYRQQREKTNLSENEYEDIIRSNLLRRELVRYLTDRIPTVAEQVHLYMIAQRTVEDAREVKQRLEAGESFFGLARELNVDEELREQSGELGWYPRYALPDNISRAAFDELDIGQYSEPLVVNQQFAAIVVVTEREDAKEIDERNLQMLKSNVLERWLRDELPHHKIVIHGLKNGYDKETEAWVRWQLQKM